MFCSALNKLQFIYANSRSSPPKVFCKKGVLRNFAEFTGKYLCQSLFSNNVTGLRPTTLLKKRLWHKCFPVNFAKFLRTPFFTEHFRWLLLKYIGSILDIASKMLVHKKLLRHTKKRFYRGYFPENFEKVFKTLYP